MQPLRDRQQAVAIVTALIMLLAAIELVRRRKLREEYSILWIGTGVVLLVLAFQQDLVVLFANLLGAASSTSALFFGALVFLMLLALQFSIRLSKLTFRNKALSQRLALLEEELDRIRRQTGTTDYELDLEPHKTEKIEKKDTA